VYNRINLLHVFVSKHSAWPKPTERTWWGEWLILGVTLADNYWNQRRERPAGVPVWLRHTRFCERTHRVPCVGIRSWVCVAQCASKIWCDGHPRYRNHPKEEGPNCIQWLAVYICSKVDAVSPIIADGGMPEGKHYFRERIFPRESRSGGAHRRKVWWRRWGTCLRAMIGYE